MVNDAWNDCTPMTPNDAEHCLHWNDDSSYQDYHYCEVCEAEGNWGRGNDWPYRCKQIPADEQAEGCGR